MPKSKKQPIQPSPYFDFSSFMASKAGLGLLMTINILPYILILSVSGITEEDTTKLLKPAGTAIVLTFIFEVWKISQIHNKKILDTAGLGLMLAIVITKAAFDNAVKPAFIVNNFFKEKVKDKTVQPVHLGRLG